MNLNDISACVRSIAQGLTYDDSLREAIAKHKLHVLLSQLPDGVPAAAPSAEGNPAGTPGAKVDVSRLSSDLPPPHDSQEEAQRAAGIWPQEAEPATVLVEPKTRGDDAHHEGLMLRPPGWPGYAAPKPSALDEMAAQAASWVGNRAVGASPALGAPYGIDATLAERGSRYGVFSKHAEVTQAIKHALFTCRARSSLAPDQVEALEMIAHKLGRIVNGDPNYADSWVDIAGYAKLVADRLEGVSR